MRLPTNTTDTTETKTDDLSVVNRQGRTVYTTVRIGLFSALTMSLVGVAPAMAQTVGVSFCTTPLAETIRNVFTIIQFGGPLLGGVIALGAIVAIPATRQVDLKKELKEIRNQAIIWGILVAPMATEIVKFLLNNVVAGGTSCGF